MTCSDFSKSNSGNMRGIDSKSEVECKNSKLTDATLQMRDNGGIDHGIEVGMKWKSHSLNLVYKRAIGLVDSLEY